jgi:hypothetical protein
MVKADAELYVRERDLPRHIAVWPRELRDYSIPGHETIIAHIQKVLRATYAAALRGHWSYDVNRHVALLSALRAEQAGLRRLKAERAAACREDAA